MGGWEREIELVLVICHDQAQAQEYMREKRGTPGRFYAWAPLWSSVVGRNPDNTLFVALGDWFLNEQCEKAYFWLRDKGFREVYPA